VNNKPEFVDAWDEPSGGALHFLSDGWVLERLEKMLVFQAWLVAIKRTPFSPALKSLRDQMIPEFARPYLDPNPMLSSPPIVLAHVPAFSLMFWVRVTGGGQDPAFDWGRYGKSGDHRADRIDHRIRDFGNLPNVRPAPGKGNRTPVIDGRTSLEQALSWLRANGLAN
jgi:hypothetical protein